MARGEVAVTLFNEGFNCSQSVLSAYSDLFGLDRKTTLKIAQAFGAGMARMGHICGAVTGAFMAIGLKYGRVSAEDEDAKEKTYGVALEFVKRFKSQHGSIICRELLGVDLSAPEGIKEAEEKNLFETLCPKFVQGAIDILEQIL